MKISWLIVFAIALIANLVAVFLNNEILIYITKPFIVISLILYFFSATRKIESAFIKIIIRALIFSGLGDLVLMFDSFDNRIFLIGMLAFLFAHIDYIKFFNIARTGEKVKLKPGLILLVVIYYLGLIYLLFNNLHDMKIPVLVYGIVISTMFLLALHMLFIKNQRAGKLIMLGALLFVTSDSVLAINRFYNSFELAGIITMVTYGLAQMLITLGAAGYIKSITGEK